MCGIIGFTGKQKASAILIDALERLEYRGYDSAGIAVIKKNEINTVKTVKRIESLREKTKKMQEDGFTGIGHTRWATHGEASLINSHPHLSENKKIAVVHNGIIENYKELKKELLKDGERFYSQTDTEVIPKLISKYYDGDILKAVMRAKKRLKGSYALGIISSDHPDKIIAVKSFSPLIIGVSEKGNFIASDVTAIAEHTNKIIYLEDLQTAVITPKKTEIYDDELNCLENKIEEINFRISDASKDGFEHFMLKEIFEQPAAFKRAIKNRIKNGRAELNELGIKKEKLKQFNKISIIACGSAYHAGIAAKYFYEELLRIPTEVEIASEYRYKNPITDHRTLTVAISQSGETADTLAALREAKKRGSFVLSVVNVLSSSIAKEADRVIYTCAGPEIAVATTKGFLTQLAALYLIGLWLAQELELQKDGLLKELCCELIELPEKIQQIIQSREEIKRYAEKLSNQDTPFFIGRNIDYAVALEASLKLKEISYIHSQAYAAGELKHGTISLIEPEKTVIALAGCEEFYDKMMSNIKEVKARGAEVLACTVRDKKEIESEVNGVIYIPKTHRLLTAALEIIPFQLYAYYVALLKGCDIDKPRNLAKSVTVE